MLNRSQILVVLATLGFSFILIFATVLKNTGMSSFEQLFFRLAFSLGVLFFALVLTRKLRFTERKDIRFFVSIGFIYAFFALSGLSSIAFGTSIPVSIALVYTQPIFTAVMSFVTRRENVTIPKAFFVLLGVAGAFLVSGLNLADPHINLGFIFPVFAGFLYAVYLWLKRQAPIDGYTPLQVLFNTFLFAIPILAAAWLIFINLSTESLFVGFVTPDLSQLILLLFFALACTVVPYGLLNYVRVKEVSATSEGTLLLGDPLLHTFWAMLIFGQYVSAIQYVGAALIVVSAALSLKVSGKNSG
jgi:drug/metabolite transporter (DMT)-like permease